MFDIIGAYMNNNCKGRDVFSINQSAGCWCNVLYAGTVIIESPLHTIMWQTIEVLTASTEGVPHLSVYTWPAGEVEPVAAEEQATASGKEA